MDLDRFPLLTPEEMVEEVVVGGQTRRLRRGLTTGAAATAAAVAAFRTLLGEVPDAVEVVLPIGRRARIRVAETFRGRDGATAFVIKDGGDDPDATHGARIGVTVGWTREGIRLAGGEGVGRVTRPGLAIPPGEPAINPVPRRMLHRALQTARDAYGVSRGLAVTVFVPDGARIAAATANPRLGILGGISILGTTGLVRPYSLASWRASVIQGIYVAAASGEMEVALVTGTRTLAVARRRWPHLAPVAVIEMGGFLGPALGAIARRPTIRRVRLLGMPGKLAKVAQGALALSAYDKAGDPAWLAGAVRRAGGSPAAEAVAWRDGSVGAVLAALAAEPAARERFFAQVAEGARAAVAARLDTVGVSVTVVDAEGTIVGEAGPA
jgi:cobalt-precorrin-5B (C1)-methyltransferase